MRRCRCVYRGCQCDTPAEAVICAACDELGIHVNLAPASYSALSSEELPFNWSSALIRDERGRFTGASPV